jgi:hypothetical protein
MKKKPMTTAELFNKIGNILKEKGKLPDILDYQLATSHPVPIKTYEFDLKTNLAYGGNEGIYLGLRIEYFAGNGWCVRDLGTFKTLLESDEAMHIMAALLADFVIEEHAYVNANLDDFTWTGADVYMLDEKGKRLKGGFSCGCMENALKRKDELLEKYPQVAVRDNATRKEKVFQQEAGGKKGGNRKCTG